VLFRKKIISKRSVWAEFTSNDANGVARNFSQWVRNSVIVSDLQPTSFTVSGLLQLLCSVYWCLHKLSTFIGQTSWTAATSRHWIGQDRHQRWYF